MCTAAPRLLSGSLGLVAGAWRSLPVGISLVRASARRLLVALPLASPALCSHFFPLLPASASVRVSCRSAPSLGELGGHALSLRCSFGVTCLFSVCFRISFRLCLSALVCAFLSAHLACGLLGSLTPRYDLLRCLFEYCVCSSLSPLTPRLQFICTRSFLYFSSFVSLCFVLELGRRGIFWVRGPHFDNCLAAMLPFKIPSDFPFQKSDASGCVSSQSVWLSSALFKFSVSVQPPL